jgi:hypothetical protein
VSARTQHHVFHDDQIAGPSDREVGFRRHNQAKHLQLGHIELALRSTQEDLAQIGRAALGSDGPQHIRHVFGALFVRWLQVIEFHLDFDVALLTLDFASPRAFDRSSVPGKSIFSWRHCDAGN